MRPPMSRGSLAHLFSSTGRRLGERGLRQATAAAEGADAIGDDARTCHGRQMMAERVPKEKIRSYGFSGGGDTRV